MSVAPPESNAGDGAALVGGCYRIEAELGHGGMARVYRALDQRSGQRVALKKLTRKGELAATLQAMFEREYHSLNQLAHPHIVRVLDYGLDADGPYYTMELLDGADAREVVRSGRLAAQRAGLLLRDAASALALIHSRRMLHRDLSPRNLWCTSDGRAKLIDFGTLVAMGTQARIAGTPPFVPPEAVHGLPLDARCDIYALGALGYFLLTGRHAYPAKHMRELVQCWQRPPARPDALQPELLRPLSDLIMAMISLDPRGRPASASEVFDRLSAMMELPAEDELEVARAFLETPQLVGREAASAFLDRRLRRAARGRGSTVAVVAPAGFGRSRMLASLIVQARLLGAAAISVDASAVGSGPLALATAIAERLVELLPVTAAAVAEVGGVLGHLSPALHHAFGDPALVELSSLQRTTRLSSALVTLFEEASRRQHVVIAVDDVQRADGASLGVLGRLSVSASQRRLLLAISCEAGAVSNAPPALEQLVMPPNVCELTPLSPEHTRALLASLFGETPELDAAAGWLHEVSQGSPQACMQYAQYLLDTGLVRYEAGEWRLAPRLRERGLPATLDAMLEGRLAELSEDARALALGLALARDDSRSAWQPERHVHFEHFPGLMGGADAARTSAALDELLAAGMVQQREAYYVLGQRAVLDALLRTAGADAIRRGHARLAEIFARPGYRTIGGAIVHLQRAGEHGRARELMLSFTAGLAQRPMDWGAMRLSLAAEIGLAALEHWRTQGGSPREGIALRRLLLTVSTVYDWSLCSRAAAAQIAQLRADCGLVHWDDTDAALSPLARVIECLKGAQQRYDSTPELERGCAPVDAVRELAGCAMSMASALVHGQDFAQIQALPSIIEPLRPLSPLVGFVADYCRLAVDRVRGSELGDRLLLAVDQLLTAEGLPDVLRRGGAAVNLHVQALEDSRRGRKRGLELMDRLAVEAGDAMFLVVHGRWLAHAFGGRAELAERFCKQVDVITEDDVWRRKAYLFVEAQLHVLTGNLRHLQRVADAIAALAEQFPGWRPWLGWVRAEMYRMRGDLASARRELDAALDQAKAGEGRAWVLIAPAHAELCLLQGDAERALREAESIVQAVEAGSLDLGAKVAAERVRALAHSSRGEHTAARASLERAVSLAAELAYDGLPLAVLCESSASIALAAADMAHAASECARLRQLIELADAPALVNAYQDLLRRMGGQLPLADLPVEASAEPTLLNASTMFSEIHTRISGCMESKARAAQALELLLQESRCDVGHLFLLASDGLFAAASFDAEAQSATLLELAASHLARELDEPETVAVSMVDLSELTTPRVESEDQRRFSPVLLFDRAGDSWEAIGVALLSGAAGRIRSPRRDLVCAISRSLRLAGDCVGRAPDATS